MIKEKNKDKAPNGAKRSNMWPKVRLEHLKTHPTCELCNGNKKVEVHHIHEFHNFPDLELDPTNLITLCENKSDGVSCHLLFGHLGCFRSINPTVVEDVKEWNQKILKRQK